MNKKRLILITSIVIILSIAVITRHAIIAVYSIISSKFKTPDIAYIKSNEWEYSEGFKVGKGDFLTFKSDLFKLSNDTIFYNERPTAIVTTLNTYFNEITLKSISSGKTGVYINIEEFSK
jgi:hypothetical protein